MLVNNAGFGTGGRYLAARAMNLPDHRGYFVRGLDPTGIVDPDVRWRAPAAPGGDAGASVGSVQDGAAALPSRPFSAQVPNAPDDQHRATRARRSRC